MIEERSGALYLGREVGADGQQGAPLWVPSKDLTTHGVCVGMTGSGKTGLCISLLEEAALQGVPALCIDPKGDLGNLLLAFPQLLPADFAPWIDAADAARRDRTVEEHATHTATQWREGLAAWGQDGARIQRLRERADFAIYTPGSSAGLSLSVLKGLHAPAPGLDDEALRDRLLATVSGLLALVGVDADPVQSREHVFVSNVVQRVWAAGDDLELGDLIRAILEPPFTEIGVLDVERFFPRKDRHALAMRLNALIASPSFASWREGEPLDIERLLYAEDGRPRVSILSIAHLQDAERMFFLTLLLGELVAWMRGQAGTSSLRALLYLDEVVGFLPPVAEPPSKKPLLTLLKQARAFGVGVLLATQNPVDVDYKALSNCGLWLLGRLQTERDVDRILDGLSGAASAAGQSFDEGALRATLAGLSQRNFLMRSVHEEQPRLFHTRWAMSYLRGPLTRQQIGRLMAERRQAVDELPPDAAADPSKEGVPGVAEAPREDDATGPSTASSAPASSLPGSGPPQDRPEVPEGVEELFFPEPGELYPGIAAWVELHYFRASAGLDHWYRPVFLAPLKDGSADLWSSARALAGEPFVETPPGGEARYHPWPEGSLGKARMRSVLAALKQRCYAEEPLILGYCRPLKLWSRVDEDREEFGARYRSAMGAARTEAQRKVGERWESKVDKAAKALDRARQKLAREEAQLERRTLDTQVSVGSAVLNAVFGGGTLRGHAKRAASSAKKAHRAREEKQDVARAEAAVTEAEAELAQVQRERSEALKETMRAPAPPVEEIRIAPRKRDIQVLRWALVWCPARAFRGPS